MEGLDAELAPLGERVGEPDVAVPLVVVDAFVSVVLPFLDGPPRLAGTDLTTLPVSEPVFVAGRDGLALLGAVGEVGCAADGWSVRPLLAAGFVLCDVVLELVKTGSLAAANGLVFGANGAAVG